MRAVQRQGVNVHPYFKEGSPPVEILKVAEEIGADLVVLGTHGRRGDGPFCHGERGGAGHAEGPLFRPDHPGETSGRRLNLYIKIRKETIVK
ncbi:MAG: universal stress protein [Candidatus Manganitrophus sp.]|nr:universal stress protein [Candidatus Manganitrophus sp.]